MPPRRRPRLRAASAVALAATAAISLAACDDGNSPTADRPQSGTGTATPAANGVQRIVVDTGPDLRFHPSTLVVHPGKVQIVLKNMHMGSSGGPPHDLKVYGLPGAYIPNIQEGQSASVTFTANAPGHYRFVCLIHVQQGQTGTLIVRRGG
ncbi:cupredoxin domain-containing protein [Jatrophihabitans endophyticus]|uniref:cupredoxin domain-containing protein n=1 Tax=Jatrophihabitans endophyticus TaxID=1206085 RepID=UPI0019FEA99B|nr:cupredoxin domain-containing protein [Jatrophihabitans endophyticus]MBE7187551.1 cupredoxin domain-containing protein [Jatrophihabitans endophyticus]